MTDPKTSVASYVSSGGLIIFGLNVNDFALLAGLAFAAGTFIVNWYYKRQHLKLIEKRVNAPFPTLQVDE